MDISTAGSLDMKFILDLYQRAFPDNERKPFSLIERKTSMGEMEILLIREERKRIGFAIVAYAEHLILLDYFAIDERWRDQGYGSMALELLEGLYSDRQMFLEIEQADEPVQIPCAKGESEQADVPLNDIRRRRKAFYLRNGMHETGIDVEMFGVKMELLSTLPGLDFEECESVYRSIYGALYRNVIRPLN
ncbi:MAG: GNAT family N-acetyltransferase [Lachnospiraceae bacterium]|nr:GNAT family N-acetyltransferase [Lachnospiraceae bacterium]